MKVLILYEELAGYFLACLSYLASDKNNQILVIMKRVNAVAPFEFKNYPTNIQIVEREAFDAAELLEKIKAFQPDCTYVAGWLYKPYHKVIRQLKLANVVIGFDNQYNGSIRQLIGSVYFKLVYKPYIQAAFVPGKKQKRFAKLLGFSEDRISEGLYCCDTELYTAYYKSTSAAKQTQFPKRFLFVGRYVNEKGIAELWKAFAELKDELKNDWELWCLGKGTLEPMKHSDIKHFGFRQAEHLEDIIANCGVFILPSRFEPWGVVIHEYAAAGFPVITTEYVGASELLVLENETGRVINEVSIDQIKGAMRKFMQMSEKELYTMSLKSHQLALQLTPAIWGERFMKLIQYER
jgi:glycosyltransferase involved in cell wall biosynthesis